MSCVVIDNSANIDAAVQLLDIPRLPCLAYTMDWVVQESLKTNPEIVEVRRRVSERDFEDLLGCLSLLNLRKMLIVNYRENPYFAMLSH